MFISLTLLHHQFSVLSGEVNICCRYISNLASQNSIKISLWIYFPLPHGATESSGPGPPHCKAFLSHSDTPQSVGLLWASEQSDAEISIREHTKLDAPVGIRTCKPSKRGSADPRLRPRGHSDMPNVCGLFYCVSVKLWHFLGPLSIPWMRGGWICGSDGMTLREDEKRTNTTAT